MVCPQTHNILYLTGKTSRHNPMLQLMGKASHGWIDFHSFHHWLAPGQDPVRQRHCNGLCQSSGCHEKWGRGAGTIPHSAVGRAAHSISLRCVHSQHQKFAGGLPVSSGTGSRGSGPRTPNVDLLALSRTIWLDSFTRSLLSTALAYYAVLEAKGIPVIAVASSSIVRWCAAGQKLPGGCLIRRNSCPRFQFTTLLQSLALTAWLLKAKFRGMGLSDLVISTILVMHKYMSSRIYHHTWKALPGPGLWASIHIFGGSGVGLSPACCLGTWILTWGYKKVTSLPFFSGYRSLYRTPGIFNLNDASAGNVPFWTNLIL